MKTPPDPKDLKKLGITEEQFKTLDGAAWRTYHAIGGECGPMSQKVIIEVICDADYMEMYGRTKDPKFYREVTRPLLDKHYGTAAFMRVMKCIFPCKRYD